MSVRGQRRSPSPARPHAPSLEPMTPCPVCGEPLPEGASFCPNCGSPVGTPLGTEERKVVTVLFADLVDSTGLAQRLDPERAREILGLFFEAASEELLALRGRAEKFIGDAVMAVFGLPTVHEDDALRAVRAGLAIRGRTRRLSQALGLATPLDVHVGVESGEAATGLGPAGQLLVTGPVVNAAARLQAAAGPGEVLAGETTVALTANAVSYGDRREATAKGFDGDTIAGFPVEGLTPRSATTHDPVRRAFERARDPAREPAPRDRHRPPGARQRPRRVRHREVAPGRRARRRHRRRRSPCSPAARVRSPTRPRSRRPRRSWPSSRASRRTTRPRRPGAGCTTWPTASSPTPPTPSSSRSGSRSCSGWPSARRTRRSCRTCRAGSSRSSTVSRESRPWSSCSRTRTSSGRRCSS